MLSHLAIYFLANSTGMDIFLTVGLPGTTESTCRCRTIELPALLIRQVKFEPSFMLKAVVGTENPVIEHDKKCG